jgi:AcrR family transcriptional regulator
MPRTGLAPAQIREKAIDATIAQMRRHGFEKVRLVDIAKDMGVSHSALYIHFASKDALLDAVSERWLDSLESTLSLITRKKKNPVARIQEWFVKLYQLKREKVMGDPELYKSFNFSAGNRKPFYEAHIGRMGRQITKMVKAANQEGQLAKYPVDKAVSLLFEATTSFHNPKMIAHHLSEKKERTLRLLLEVVTAGLS